MVAFYVVVFTGFVRDCGRVVDFDMIVVHVNIFFQAIIFISVSHSGNILISIEQIIIHIQVCLAF